MAAPSKNPKKILTKHTNREMIMIRKQQKTTVEQDRALREQLHIEIENRTKACSNIVYDCSLPRIEGYEYCLKHILQDPNAPYKQCTYLYPTNNKRCQQPAPVYDPKKDCYTTCCFEHSRLSQLTKTRETIGKFKNVLTNETLLNGLVHHVNPEKHLVDSTDASVYNDSGESDVDITKPFVNPFLDIDAVVKQDSGRHLLDYASDSSTDEDEASLCNTWKPCDIDCSDNESVDSQGEDLLKHAGIYTTEEVVQITKQKMIRLQDLYIDQVYRLQHLLKEKRRKYLHTLRIEKESMCSIYDQMKDKPSEQRQYDKLKALNRYHRRNGIESILYRKYLDKRANSATQKPPQQPHHLHKCLYTEGGVRCYDRVMPCSRYCRKHILEDKKQILYRSCHIEKSGVICQEPVMNIFDDTNTTCVLHIELPPQRDYTQKKYESDSDEEDPSSVNALPKNDIKIETDSVSQQCNDDNSINVTTAANTTTTTTTRSEDECEMSYIRPEDVEMFCTEEDVGTNVTISHDEDADMSSISDINIVTTH